MKILIDLNCWIDLAARPTSYPQTAEAYKLLRDRRVTSFVAGCSYTTLYYLLERLIGRKGSLEFLTLLQQDGVKVASFGDAEAGFARKLEFSDFEDACVAASGFNSGSDLLMTRNKADFKKSPVRAVSPGEVCKLLA